MILSTRTIFVTGRNYVDSAPENIRQWPIKEMKAQIGYARSLIKNAQWSQTGRICADNYRYARDCALANGLDVTNFPKSIRGGFVAR